MAGVRVIPDGFALEIGCADGALMEIQVLDEETPCKTWELLIYKGALGTLDTLTVPELRKVGEGLLQLAEAVERRAL